MKYFELAECKQSDVSSQRLSSPWDGQAEAMSDKLQLPNLHMTYRCHINKSFESIRANQTTIHILPVVSNLHYYATLIKIKFITFSMDHWL